LEREKRATSHPHQKPRYAVFEDGQITVHCDIGAISEHTIGIAFACFFENRRINGNVDIPKIATPISNTTR
jgi:hypothetical protein